MVDDTVPDSPTLASPTPSIWLPPSPFPSIALNQAVGGGSTPDTADRRSIETERGESQHTEKGKHVYRINLLTLAGDTHTLSVDSSATVWDVMEAAKTQAGFTLTGLRLMWGEVLLDRDEEKLADLGIEDDAVLTITRCKAGPREWLDVGLKEKQIEDRNK